MKNLHLSMRYLSNAKRQNSHRITWKERKVKSLWQRAVIFIRRMLRFSIFRQIVYGNKSRVVRCEELNPNNRYKKWINWYATEPGIREGFIIHFLHTRHEWMKNILTRKEKASLRGRKSFSSSLMLLHLSCDFLD